MTPDQAAALIAKMEKHRIYIEVDGYTSVYYDEDEMEDGLPWIVCRGRARTFFPSFSDALTDALP